MIFGRERFLSLLLVETSIWLMQSKQAERDKDTQLYFSVMDSSKILGGAEEYSSSESGWTMYIDSSIHEVYDSDQDNHSTDKRTYDYYKNNRNNHNHNDDDGNKSDDSMASDASSGPSHQLSRGSSKQSLGIGFKQAATKYPSKQVLNQQVKKKDKRTQAEKSMVKAKSTTSHVQSGTKMRKTN